MIVKLYSNNNSPESGWNKKGEKIHIFYTDPDTGEEKEVSKKEYIDKIKEDPYHHQFFHFDREKTDISEDELKEEDKSHIVSAGCGRGVGRAMLLGRMSGLNGRLEGSERIKKAIREDKSDDEVRKEGTKGALIGAGKILAPAAMIHGLFDLGLKTGAINEKTEGKILKRVYEMGRKGNAIFAGTAAATGLAGAYLGTSKKADEVLRKRREVKELRDEYGYKKQLPYVKNSKYNNESI